MNEDKLTQKIITMRVLLRDIFEKYNIDASPGLMNDMMKFVMDCEKRILDRILKAGKDEG